MPVVNNNWDLENTVKNYYNTYNNDYNNIFGTNSDYYSILSALANNNGIARYMTTDNRAEVLNKLKDIYNEFDGTFPLNTKGGKTASWAKLNPYVALNDVFNNGYYWYGFYVKIRNYLKPHVTSATRWWANYPWTEHRRKRKNRRWSWHSQKHETFTYLQFYSYDINGRYSEKKDSCKSQINTLKQEITRMIIDNCDNDNSLLTVSNTASDGEDGFDTCNYTIGEVEKSLSDWITYLQGNFNAMYAISQSVMQVFKNGEVNEGNQVKPNGEKKFPQYAMADEIDKLIDRKSKWDPRTDMETKTIFGDTYTVSKWTLGQVKAMITENNNYSTTSSFGPLYSSKMKDDDSKGVPDPSYNIQYSSNPNKTYIGIGEEDWYIGKIDNNDISMNLPYVISNDAYTAWETCTKAVDMSKTYDYGTADLFEMWTDVSNALPGNTMNAASNIVNSARNSCEDWIEMFNVWGDMEAAARDAACVAERPNENTNDQVNIKRITNYYEAAQTRITNLKNRLAVIQKYITPYPEPSNTSQDGSNTDTTTSSTQGKNESILRLKEDDITLVPYSVPSVASVRYIFENGQPPTSQAPTQYLEMLVPNGKPGNKGPRGQCGVQGEHGFSGPPGPVGYTSESLLPQYK